MNRDRQVKRATRGQATSGKRGEGGRPSPLHAEPFDLTHGIDETVEQQTILDAGFGMCVTDREFARAVFDERNAARGRLPTASYVGIIYQLKTLGYD